MAISDVGIVNSALIKLGVQKITTLADNTRQAIIMNEQYSKLRDALLYDHPWNFSMKWFTLTNNLAVHSHPDFTYEMALPATYLRVWKLEYADEPYEVLDGKFYCNSETIKAKIIQQITDPTKFTAGFAEALACKLAADTCYALVQSNSLKNTFIQEMMAYIPTVRSADAQENPPDAFQQDVFLNARR